MSEIHELFNQPLALSSIYILETKENFHEIGWLKAKLIRWLHLEKFVGTVYLTDTEGLRLLSEKVERTYKRVTPPLPPGYYEHVISLLNTLHYIRPSPSSLDPIQKLISSLTEIISSYLKSQNSTEKKEYSRYGTLKAEEFLKSHSCEKEESSFIEHGKEACVALRREFPEHSKEVVKAFVARIQKTVPEDSITQILMQYFVSRFLSFYNVDQKPSPSALAEWFKGILEEMSEQFKEQAADLQLELICSMKRHVSADDLKESLRGYGAFVAQGERDEGNTQSTEQVQPFQIMLAFETKASSLSTRFSGDEFRSVMEGMMDRKGVEYCKAVAGEMSAKNLSELLSSYVDRFSLFFSSASDQVVQGVIRELLRLNKCPKDELCKILVDSFMNIYQSKKQFSVFAPLLGTQIMVQRPVAKEAMDRSLKDKYGQVRFDSCTNVWSSVDKDTVLNIKVSQALQQIEKDIVTKMLTQGSHFPQFYGRFIAQKIKQGVGAPETLKKTYTDFITKNFAQNFDEQSRIMKTVMQKELAPPSPQRSPLRTATPQAWQEDGDI